MWLFWTDERLNKLYYYESQKQKQDDFRLNYNEGQLKLRLYSHKNYKWDDLVRQNLSFFHHVTDLRLLAAEQQTVELTGRRKISIQRKHSDEP